MNAGDVQEKSVATVTHDPLYIWPQKKRFLIALSVYLLLWLLNLVLNSLVVEPTCRIPQHLYDKRYTTFSVLQFSS